MRRQQTLFSTPRPTHFVRCWLVVGATLALMAPRAQAAALFDCDAADSLLVCRLKSVLTGLQTLAGILAVLLILAILLAVRAYRRKGRKTSPEDITRDVR